MKIISLEKAEANDFCDDIIEDFKMLHEDDPEAEAQIIEATIGELAALKAGTQCGVKPNHCYVTLAREFASLRVRACLWKEYPDYKDCWRPYSVKFVTGSVEIFLPDEKTGDRIEVLAEKGGGTLRFEWDSPGWNYFETE